MRDILSDFGVVKTAASSAVASFPYGVDAGQGGNLGRLCDLWVHVKVEGSTAVPAAEVLTFDVLHKADKGAGAVVHTFTRPAKALAVGGDITFKLPADHLRYLTLQVKSSATANISLHAYLEEGEGKTKDLED